MTRLSPSLVLFISASFWGLYWVPLRQIETLGLTGTWGVALFNAGPLIVLIPWLVRNRASQMQNLRAVAIIGLVAGTGMSLYASGLIYSSVIRVTLLFYLTPIWSTIFGVLWLSERLRPGRIAAIVLGLTGLWLLLANNDPTVRPLNAGDLMALLSGVFWGLGATGLKKWPQAPTMITTACQLFVTSVVCILLGLFVFDDALPGADVILSALPIALGASILVLLPSVIAIFWASKRLFPGRVGILMMSEVLVAIPSASLLLPDEMMSFWQWVGGAIILIACLVEVAAGGKGDS